MKKESNKNTEAQLLALLKRVLPKATTDADLAGKIYSAVESELRSTSRTKAFEKFCARVELPDLEPASLEEVKRQLSASFGTGDVTLKPNKKEKSLALEIALPDGAAFSGVIKVNAGGQDASDDQPLPPFVPFPVCLPGDTELVWLLGKRENLSPDEAGIALSKAQEDFWGSKAGQRLLRDRVERGFVEFIGRVPAGLLSEAGLKRHYKMPEALKVLRNGTSKAK
jgi:hypothetical protein